MSESWINISAADGGTFAAFLAKPQAGIGPGIVLIQEIFGVNKVMRDIAIDLSRLGYVVACPDLFWRQEPRVDITDQTDAEWKKAFDLFKGFDQDKGVQDLDATLATLRAMDDCTGKVGAVGYCLGGKLAYSMATRTSIDCSVGYYGVGIEAALDEADQIKKPLMLHIAEKDKFVPPDAQEKIKAKLSGYPMVTLHSYPGMDHAFARVGGAHYDVENAALANTRTTDFFANHLK
ncbi:MAG: carboxymethylenebutenolidase [Rhodospirillaceae bacterium]|nr:carboxymethylenebutenolidase [Rhodospirillaceae bacterium]|tara:strand:- start:506 stop:1207 length:702 start_codon:yes stop_codon:yes gene_type:complete